MCVIMCKKGVKDLRVGVLNVRSLNEKEDQVIKCVNAYKLDILGLSEIKKRGCGEEMWGESMFIWSGFKRGHAREGVGIVVGKELLSCLRGYKCVSSRCMWVKMKVGIQKIKIVVAYAPVNDKPDDVKEQFWAEVDEICDDRELNEGLMLLGDMNGRVGGGQILDKRVIGQWGEGGDALNCNGRSLIRLCARCELFVANTWFRHKDAHKLTWYCEKKGRREVLDYICVDEKFRVGVKDARVYRGAGVNTDHELLVCAMRIDGRWRKRQAVVEEGKIKAWKLKDENTRARFCEVVRERFQTLSPVDQTLDGRYEFFSRCLVDSAVEICGRTKKRKIVYVNKWWNREAESLVKEKAQARLEYQDGLRGEEEYKIVKRRTRNGIRRIKQRAKAREEEKLSELCVSNITKFWKEVNYQKRGGGTVKGVKDSNGELVVADVARCKLRKDHFERVYNPDMDGRKADVRDNIRGEDRWSHPANWSDISRKEFDDAVREMKNGKASGIDEITVEMIRCGGDIVADYLFGICRLAWQCGRVPNAWLLAVIIALFKNKGSVYDCENYRGISLLAIPSKVYSRIVIGRVGLVTDDRVLDLQGAFAQGRGCADQIFVMRLIVEKYLEKDKRVYAVFVDLEKAYDRVDREDLWKVLRQYGVTGKLLEAVRSMYDGTSACVRDGVLSDWFPIKSGVKQGCVMSPKLFNLYMDACVREVLREDMGGVMVGGRKVSILLYADDAVLLAESEQELQLLVDRFCMVCSKRKLKINENKTKTMVFDRDGSGGCEIMVGEVKLEEVREFKYLGSILQNDGKVDREVEGRVVAGARVLGATGNIIRGRNVSMKVKKTIFSSVLVPTLAYASETYACQARHKSRMQACEMRFLRAACGVTRRDRIRNDRVRQMCGVKESLVSVVTRSRLRWYGHMERMGRDRLTKMIYDGEVAGRRGRGRPRTRWSDCMKDDLRALGMDVAEAQVLCQDRTAWRRRIRCVTGVGE